MVLKVLKTKHLWCYFYLYIFSPINVFFILGASEGGGCILLPTAGYEHASQVIILCSVALECACQSVHLEMCFSTVFRILVGVLNVCAL